MSNAHLPNSHPDITPGWRQHSFPRTPFLDAIKTRPIEGSHGQRYGGIVPPDWCSTGEPSVFYEFKHVPNEELQAGRRWAAHGGFCATVLMTVACQYNREKHEHLQHTEPTSLFVEYLEPVPEGPYQIVLESLQVGNRGTSIQARLVPDEGQDPTTYVVALIRLGILKEEKKTHNIQPPVGRLPDRFEDCDRWSDATYYRYNPPASSVRSFTPKDGGSPLWSPKFGGQNARDQWSKLDDGGTFRLEHLPLLADLVPAIPLNYEKNGLLGAARYRTPTTSLHIMFRSEVNNHEWLLTRTVMHRLHGGKFDMSMQILNEEGQVVATCVQVCAMIPQTKPRSKPDGKL